MRDDDKLALSSALASVKMAEAQLAAAFQQLKLAQEKLDALVNPPKKEPRP